MVPLVTVAGDGLDDALRIHHAHPVVGPVGNIQVAFFVDHHAGRQVEAGLGGGAAVAAESRRAVAGDGGDDAFLIDLTHAVIVPVRDIQVAVGIEGQTGGNAQLRFRGGAAVAGMTGSTGAHHVGQHTFLVDAADQVMAMAGDINIAIGSHRNTVHQRYRNFSGLNRTLGRPSPSGYQQEAQEYQNIEF